MVRISSLTWLVLKVKGYDYESPEKGVGGCCSSPAFQMELRKAKNRWSVRTHPLHLLILLNEMPVGIFSSIENGCSIPV